MRYDRLKDIPLLVRVLAFTYDGWVVGGGALYLAGKTDDLPRDWDVVVGTEKWSEVVHIVPPTAKINSWGGFKVNQDGIEVDFWPEDLGHYFRSIGKNIDTALAVHIRTQRTLKLKLSANERN